VDQRGQAEGRRRLGRLRPPNEPVEPARAKRLALATLGVVGAVLLLATGLDGCTAPSPWGTVDDGERTFDAWAAATDERDDPRDLEYEYLVVDDRKGLAALVYTVRDGESGCFPLPSSVEVGGDVVRLRVGDWEQGPLAAWLRPCPTDDVGKTVGAVTVQGELGQFDTVVDGTCLLRAGIREACERDVVRGVIERTAADRP
jgi:hypothetical protein